MPVHGTANDSLALPLRRETEAALRRVMRKLWLALFVTSLGCQGESQSSGTSIRIEGPPFQPSGGGQDEAGPEIRVAYPALALDEPIVTDAAPTDAGLVVVGSALVHENEGSTRRGFVLRLDVATLTLDPSFGTGGVMFVAAPHANSHIESVLAYEGAFIVAGFTWDGAHMAQALVRRVSLLGEQDPLYREPGEVAQSGEEGASAINALAAFDGDVIAAGRASDALLLTRLKNDGALNPMFGSNGLAKFRFNEAPAVALDVASADNALFVGGVAGTPLLVKVDGLGDLDATFDASASLQGTTVEEVKAFDDRLALIESLEDEESLLTIVDRSGAAVAGTRIPLVALSLWRVEDGWLTGGWAYRQGGTPGIDLVVRKADEEGRPVNWPFEDSRELLLDDGVEDSAGAVVEVDGTTVIVGVTGNGYRFVALSVRAE